MFVVYQMANTDSGQMIPTKAIDQQDKSEAILSSEDNGSNYNIVCTRHNAPALYSTEYYTIM